MNDHGTDDPFEGQLRRLAFRAPVELDVEAALRRVHARMDEPPVRALPRRLAASAARAAWRIAAVLVLVFGAAILYRSRVAGRSDAVEAARTVATGVGERDSLVLADGTRVLLAPASRVQIPTGYAAGHRELLLRGEALLDVHHDPKHPLTVRVGSAVLRDVGTRFVVREEEGGGVRVTVTSGAVLLRPQASESGGVLVRAGQAGVMTVTGAARAAGADTAGALAWTRGELVLDDAPMDRVATELRRWYGLHLRVADTAFADRHVTATFERESALGVARVIGLALGAPARIAGDTLVLGAEPTP
jgi:transmembrane sensor